MSNSTLDMEKVLILMSTYNGEQYLSEQLDSILSQEDIEIHLLIRDDGSSDRTIDIINDYSSQYPDKIDSIFGKNIGWINSFFSLMSIAYDTYSGYRYFAFSDQDDIWLPRKIKRSLDLLTQLPEGPNLYCSNLIYYRDGHQLGLVRKSNIKPTFKGCLIRNYATGCTVTFNLNLLEMMVKTLPSIKIAHDYWCYLTAVLCGNVIIDSQSFTLYRQHQSNQIGNKSGFFEIWHRRLKSFDKLIGHHDKENLAKEIIRIYGTSMHEEAKHSVIKLANYRNSLANKIALLSDSGFSFDKIGSDFWLKLRIIFGKL